MPGVTIHPPPPGLVGLSPLHSPLPDKYSPPSSMSVADIKNRAKETVRREANKGSAVSLINVARDLILRAKEKETLGDLHGALENYIKTATLLRMTMDSTEFKQEKGQGVVRKAVQDFLSGVGSDLNSRTQSVEERIKSFEATRQSSNADSDDKPVNQSSGGSIADRMRALQDHGLSISSTKRLPREPPSLPLLPARPLSSLLSSAPTSTLPSPAASSHTPVPSPSLGPPPPQTLAPTSSLGPPTSHTFVPASSLGPPSPPSSPPTSPPSDAISSFSHNFPSIHKLEESLDFNLPSVPTSISNKSSKPSSKEVQIGDVPSPSSSHFGNLALHIERPSSTPITPTTNVFNSRPASPTRVNAPHKPSGLSKPTTDDIPRTAPKIPIPHTNTAFPKDLQKYMQDYTVLVIDVRNRADFDKEHVRAQSVVCIEPSVLLRGNVTAEALEDSMVIAPKGEAKLFSHRDQFDIVAVCDETSTSFGSGNSPLSILVRVINEQAFRKYLKRMPMLLVGGLEGWKRDLGEGEVVHGDESQSVSTGSLSSQHSGSSASLKTPNPNLFMNGLSSSSTSGSASSGQFSPPIPSSSPRLPNHGGSHRSTMSLDQSPSHTRLPAEVNHTGGSFNTSAGALQRRPAIRTSMSQNGPASPSTLTNGPFSPISYPQFNRQNAPASSPALNSGVSGFMTPPDIKSPPPASLNPSSTRRRNDYLDQSQEAFSGYNSHPSSHIDYPELLPIRPPPAAAASALERQDQRPRLPPKPDFGQPPSNSLTISAPGPNGAPALPNGVPKPPRIESDYPVTYWMDVKIGLSGLKNLGNTCYMNAPIQCLSATVPFSRFFTEHRWKNAINFTNPLGSKGRLTGAFATLLYQMWGQDLPYLTPIEFRKSICQLRSQYDNSDQHDSQEFLSFLMDGIHEDLNRVIVKPKWTQTPEQEAELETLPPLIASEREWKAWKARNDSIIVDYFQGQFRSRLQCLTCHQTSTTYNVFSILQLPIPHGRNGRVPIEKCLDAFFNEEILEKDDAWDCPKCKTKRRASKTLSLARLPPVLLIHFKRFEANGRFSDKIDTFVEYPMKSLDLTNYMPAPLPPGADRSELNGGLPMSLDDPRSQLPPYRYELYAVTNHYGNLTSGHYTSFVASRGGWMYCDDSSIKSVEPKSVINQKAYVLFYKRVR